MKKDITTDDDLLGGELDHHLEARRRGEMRSVETDSSELDELKAVVDCLDDLARSTKIDAAFPEQLGKYRIIRCIGQGGQSRAFLAFDPDLCRQIVIKYYHHADTQRARESVLTEARALARVTSPYVAACHAVDRHGDTPYLVLDRVRGRSLAELLDQGGLRPRQRIELVASVAEGLADVHAAGLLHRDIKPGNIIVGNDSLPKLIDFGLASDCLDMDVVSRQGTVAYMSPEQARGEWEHVDQRSDIFSLGAVLYELISGRPVYSAPDKATLLQLARTCKIAPLQEADAGVPASVIELCMQCLSENPAQRPASAATLARDLRKCWRLPWKSAGLLAAVVAIPLIIALGLSLNKPSEPPSVVQEAANLPPVHDWETVFRAMGQRSNVSEDVLGLRSDFPIAIRVDDETILGLQPHVAREGEITRISVHSDEACFIVVYSIEFDAAQSISEIVRLFPANRTERNFVAPGAWLDLPEFEATADESTTWLYVLASTDSLRIEDAQAFGSPVRRGEWESEVRGYRRLKRLSERMLPYEVTPQAVSQ